MKSSFCIDLQRFMLTPIKFPLSLYLASINNVVFVIICFVHARGLRKRKKKKRADSHPPDSHIERIMSVQTLQLITFKTSTFTG